MAYSTFYGIANTMEGKACIIHSLPSGRIQAEQAAREHCRKHGLSFQYILPDKRTLRQPEPRRTDWKERFASNRGSLAFGRKDR
ncbi:hypothetical protein K0T92_04845 [Paenibacillus oenotherae]|uniref:Uncharacterized protein n=1 Tax=Paenibacillus oenotherae TaxID=1435645 RepID=A0ABS7D2D9_9BACL|nr:hypothetical protein [Paenibacillus oenotherae]MBW7474060.1 hypothetical protein [Paenibacillus oenotherae]